MPRGAATDTRVRMLDAAAEVLRERGTGGFTLDAVLARSGAPRGSTYHHFPGGRDELLIAAVQHSAGYISHLIDKAAAAGDPGGLLDVLADFWRRSLLTSDFRTGCPVLAVAVDARSDLPEASTTVAAVFGSWQDSFAALLERTGASPERARRLAATMLAAVEGAIVLCRAARSTRPLDDVVLDLKELLAGATASSAGPTR